MAASPRFRVGTGVLTILRGLWVMFAGLLIMYGLNFDALNARKPKGTPLNRRSRPDADMRSQKIET